MLRRGRGNRRRGLRVKFCFWNWRISPWESCGGERDRKMKPFLSEDGNGGGLDCWLLLRWIVSLNRRIAQIVAVLWKSVRLVFFAVCEKSKAKICVILYVDAHCRLYIQESGEKDLRHLRHGRTGETLA